MTEQPSETGTADEARFGPWLADALCTAGTFGNADVLTFAVGPGDARHCVAMFLRGGGRATVLLTGHYDTVTTADYGDLRPLATQPEPLLAALREKLAGAETPADRLARHDLESGDYLPGRGLLDMKAGLAAGLAAAERFAAGGAPAGNLLFLAVPDEENASAGARAAAPALFDLARRWEIDIVAAINLDAIADSGDGSAGRAIATGTVGKVLPTAFVAGVPTHSGFPLGGINAGVLLAAIVARIEWAAELTDTTADTPGTPPSLLSLRDGKTGYDVTTPATAFATFNVLLHRRTPADILDAFDGLCREAVADCLHRLTARAKGLAVPAVPVLRYAGVLAAARRRQADLEQRIAALDLEGLPLPERCREVTALVWAASGRAGPAVVTGFGSIPYLATALSRSPRAGRLHGALVAAAAAAAEPVAVAQYFAGISDMSFFGEADTENLGIVAANTPPWQSDVRWPDAGLPAGLPTINIGPWGRDYHTPLERMHTGYGFGTLPRLVGDVVDRVLRG